MPHRIIVSLVTWNSAHHLDALFASLKAQTEKAIELLVTDNASQDDTLVRLSELLPSLPFPTTLFREKENIGFSAAHNHHIREAVRRKALFFFVVNPDCILEAHAIAMLKEALLIHDDAGSAGGKMLRAHFAVVHGLTEAQKTSTIDSSGLAMTRARRWEDRGNGEEDRGQHVEGPVFGVGGAFALYRIRALLQAAIKHHGKREFFDEDFFSYKEDIDLAWRLQLLGWSSWYTPHAIAWHHRRFGKEQREAVPARLRALSWRNHFFVLLKNDDVGAFVRDLPLTFLRECGKFLWILLREPKTLQLFPTFFTLWYRIVQKRQWIMQHRRRNPAVMRELFRSFRSSSSITKRAGS